jgi:hypothetical protein
MEKDAPIQTSNESAPEQRDYKPVRYPRPTTFSASVLITLLEGKKLTEQPTFYCTELQRAVWTLHGFGWPIKMKTATIYVRNGLPRKVTKYSLDRKFVIWVNKHSAGTWRQSARIVREVFVATRAYRSYRKNGLAYPPGIELLMTMRGCLRMVKED